MADPVLLLTGASSGIGAALARAAAPTHRLVLAARGPVEAHPGAVTVRCDVTEWADVRHACATAVERFGRLDVAIANAGVSGPSSFLDGEPDGWREIVLTNVLGTALTARAALPHLVSTRGHLVITGSVAGTVTVPGDLYAATKAAVTALARGLRAEFVGTGVRVTLVQPGLTDAGSRSPGRAGDPALDPTDVARAVLFALRQPPHVEVGEVVVRPTGQDPRR